MHKIDIVSDHTDQPKLLDFILLNSHRQLIPDRDPEQKNISKISSVNPQIAHILKILEMQNTKSSVK